MVAAFVNQPIPCSAGAIIEPPRQQIQLTLPNSCSFFNILCVRIIPPVAQAIVLCFSTAKTRAMVFVKFLSVLYLPDKPKFVPC